MDEFKKLLEKEGVQLKELGINGRAFYRESAFIALEILKKNKIPVLGGDVLILKKGEIKMTYNNWYCKEDHYKSYSEYLENSWRITEEYLNLFIDNDEERYLYLFVI